MCNKRLENPRGPADNEKNGDTDARRRYRRERQRRGTNSKGKKEDSEGHGGNPEASILGGKKEDVKRIGLCESDSMQPRPDLL